MPKLPELTLFNRLEADNSFQALVVLDYFFHPDKSLAQKNSFILLEGMNAQEFQRLFQLAVQYGFIPDRMSPKETEAFLQRPRDYKLVVLVPGKPGFLGIGKSSMLFKVEVIDRCPKCGGEIGLHFTSFNFKYHTVCLACNTCQYEPQAKVYRPDRPHEFGSESIDNCQQARRCQLCGEKEEVLSAKHQFGDWKDNPGQICQQVRTCIQCHATEWRIAHEEVVLSETVLEYGWNEWEGVGRHRYKREAACSRCGATWSYEITRNETN